jgi:phosphatidylglycerol:prolipoprotein diacylglycerol transferase
MHPEFDPVAIWLGPFPIRWYGIMYLLAFVSFLLLGKEQLKKSFRFSGIYRKDLDDLLMYGIFGVILGGRLGYVVFYKPMYYFLHPLEIFAVWQGGMSFHGGLIGVILSLMIFAYNRPMLGRRKIIREFKLTFFSRFFMITDFVAPLVPLGLMFGRLGNFINGELYGRVTDVQIMTWAIIFPQSGTLDPRHPSQIYQAFGEGFLLFLILFNLQKIKSPIGTISASFLIGYGFFRFIIEFFREPDSHLGFVFDYLTVGQLLCVPMVFLGILLLIFSLQKKLLKKC